MSDTHKLHLAFRRDESLYFELIDPFMFNATTASSYGIFNIGISRQIMRKVEDEMSSL